MSLVLEMTREPGLALSLLTAAALGYGVRKLFLRESAYTARLARQGRRVGQALLREDAGRPEGPAPPPG